MMTGIVPCRVGAQRTSGVEAAHARHHHVEHDEFGPLGLQAATAAAPSPTAPLVADLTELEDDEFADVFVVVGYNDSGHGFPLEMSQHVPR